MIMALSFRKLAKVQMTIDHDSWSYSLVIGKDNNIIIDLTTVNDSCQISVIFFNSIGRQPLSNEQVPDLRGPKQLFGKLRLTLTDIYMLIGDMLTKTQTAD